MGNGFRCGMCKEYPFKAYVNLPEDQRQTASDKRHAGFHKREGYCFIANRDVKSNEPSCESFKLNV